MLENKTIDPFRKELITPVIKKAPIARKGGKRYLSKYICKIINSIEFKVYCEPFIGGGRIFFEKEPNYLEIINDAERRLANIYFCIRKFPEEFYELQQTLVKDENYYKRLALKYHNPTQLKLINEKIQYSWENMELMDKKKETIEESNVYSGLKYKQDMLEEAIDYFFYSNMSFLGLHKDNMMYPEKDSNDTSGRIRWRIHRPLIWVSERMKRTTVMNKDFVKVIKFALDYKYPKLFYFDPPYWGVSGYEIEFPLMRYFELSFWLNQIKFPDYFILSVNDVPTMRKIFGHFKIERVPTRYTQTSHDGSSHKKVFELLITPHWKPIKKQSGLETWIKSSKNEALEEGE
jgi:DNA adenine methylase